MNFSDEHWPLHSALAWVLTRDVTFTEGAEFSDFHPDLSDGKYQSVGEVNEAWDRLHETMVAGKTKVMAMGAERQLEPILPEEIKELDWVRDESGNALDSRDRAQRVKRKGLRKDVVVLSETLLCVFKSSDPAIARNSDDLGSPASPTGPGYMTLTDAVFWIATEGGNVTFWLRESEPWRKATKSLLDNISSGNVKAVGRFDDKGLPQSIDGAAFVGIEVPHPYEETPMALILGERPHIRLTAPLLAEDTWQVWNDTLEANKTTEISHIQVSREDVARLWSFTARPAVPPPSAKPRISQAAIEPAFRRWRAQQPQGYIPTEQDDIAYMKTLGVSREQVRVLRKNSTRRARGQKK